MARHRIKLFDREVPLPHSRPLRIGIGVVFIAGGFLGFLPVLGFWMVPIGLLVLSIDLPSIRRLRRRMEVRFLPWWRRQTARWRGRAAPERRHRGLGKADVPVTPKVGE